MPGPRGGAMEGTAEGVKAHGPWQSEALSEPLRSLLAELAREVAGLSSENAALRKQVAHGSIGAEAYFTNGNVPAPVAAGEVAEGKDSVGMDGRESRASERGSEGSTPLATPQQVSMATTRRWQLQFARLCREGELLRGHDLWLVVSEQEHRLAGHTQHTLRVVKDTLQLIRETYGATAQPPGEEEALDWETFLAFMSDDDNSRLKEGAFLRKALRAEANEYMAEQARREIAERQLEDVDPKPHGWRALVLERLPPPVILANAICLGIASDIDSIVWEGFEVVFCAFYALEVFLKAKFLGWRRYLTGADALWHLFDILCLLLSLTDFLYRAFRLFADAQSDPEALAVLKFLRLARLTRVIKSFRSHYFDDLKTMSLGLLSGAKVLAWAVVLFTACVFVLGVVMKEAVGMDWPEFANVPRSMFSVFRCLTDGCAAYDGTPLHEHLRESYGPIFMVPYIFIFLVVEFGLFNLIVAVFIDRVVAVSVRSKQQELGQREREMRLAIEEMIVGLMPGFNVEAFRSARTGSRTRRFYYSKSNVNSGNEERLRAVAKAMQELREQRVQITRELFGTWLTDPEVLQLMENLEIDTATKAEIFDVCDVDKSGSLTCDELVNGLMRLRGPISKCDVIAIRLKVRYLTNILEDMHHSMGA